MSKKFFDDTIKPVCFSILLDSLGGKPHLQEEFNHSMNVSTLAVDLGIEYNLTKDDVFLLGLAGALHDIGKRDIPESIVCKKGLLAHEEWKIIKTHPRTAFDSLYKFKGGPEDCLYVAGTILVGHHEWRNLNPYPRSANGKAYCGIERRINDPKINMLSQVLAAADCFNALATSRPYGPAFSYNEIKNILFSEYAGKPAYAISVLERHNDYRV